MIRLLIAGAVAMGLSLIGTRSLIRLLVRHRVGQPIHEDLEAHQEKAGTPTMGGIAIVAAAFVAYVGSDLVLKLTNREGVFTTSGIITILAIVAAGIVGFLDDLIKVRRERNLGLNKRMKVLGLLTVAVGWSIAMVYFTAQHTTVSLTRYDLPGWELGKIGWTLLAVLLILASTNAVNLTDGMDGLAGGSAIFAFGAFTIIGFWSLRHPEVYTDINSADLAVIPLDLAVVAIAMLGACVGFLWWNAAPARIFMGDTGALAIGAALACLALALNTQLLLVFIGGLFVMETVSVIIQVVSFRLFGGRRVFRMAPIHHHFELRGWPETTVIIRFWILAGLAAALGLGIYYYDFLATGAADL